MSCKNCKCDGVHPRTLNLIDNKEPFIVVKCSEPYARKVMELIKEDQMSKGKWTEDCEKWMNENIPEK